MESWEPSQQVLEQFKDQVRPKLYLKIQFVVSSNHTPSRLLEKKTLWVVVHHVRTGA